jgi:hypothetical protein
LADGLFSLDNFFGLSDGAAFGSEYDRSALFQNDTFGTNEGETFTGFDPATGVLLTGGGGTTPPSVPDSASTLLLASGVTAVLIGVQRKRARP